VARPARLRLQAWEPGQEMAVYDLGFLKQQLLDMACWRDVQVWAAAGPQAPWLWCLNTSCCRHLQARAWIQWAAVAWRLSGVRIGWGLSGFAVG